MGMWRFDLLRGLIGLFYCFVWAVLRLGFWGFIPSFLTFYFYGVLYQLFGFLALVVCLKYLSLPILI